MEMQETYFTREAVDVFRVKAGAENVESGYICGWRGGHVPV
jgi:hypothetical protein